ncbi:MAG: hypothetical protein LBL46_05050 [Rickettsiales bacterium]|jgi:hypothetical protein|nr:hypothetical protein [Rickettsiales bacterium]
MKPGKVIIPLGAIPEPHEIETGKFFAALGNDVEFLPPSYMKGVFSPDMLMNGTRWEIKAPCGDSKRTIENNYRSAERQSQNVIFDLRRVKLGEKIAIGYIKQQFNLRRSKIKRIIVITKDKKYLDLTRKK